LRARPDHSSGGARPGLNRFYLRLVLVAFAGLGFFAAGLTFGFFCPPPKILSQPEANCFVDPVWTVYPVTLVPSSLWASTGQTRCSHAEAIKLFGHDARAVRQEYYARMPA